MKLCTTHASVEGIEESQNEEESAKEEPSFLECLRIWGFEWRSLFIDAKILTETTVIITTSSLIFCFCNYNYSTQISSIFSEASSMACQAF